MQPVVLNRQRALRVDTRALGEFLARLVAVRRPDPAGELVVCLVSDRTMVRLQRTFRGRRTTTDVLSFPAGRARDGDGRRRLGDIAISVPQARRQGRRAGHGLRRELELLLLHGYLHLLGYDHEVDGGRMRRLERRLRRRLLAPRVLAAAGGRGMP